MKYKIELRYDEDIQKTIEYDNNAKNKIYKYIFYFLTDTKYDERIDIFTSAENVLEYDYTKDFNSIYDEIIELFQTMKNIDETNILLDPLTYKIKINLLMNYNIITNNIIYTEELININSLKNYIKVIYNDTLIGLKYDDGSGA